jgi:hypothetical protein
MGGTSVEGRSASDVWRLQLKHASAFAGRGTAQGAAGGGGWDGGGGGELANSGVPLSGVPLSMQAVVSSVVELYRLRSGLEEVQKGNALIVQVVAKAASLELLLPTRLSGRKPSAGRLVAVAAPSPVAHGSSRNLGATSDTDDDFQVGALVDLLG